MTDTTEHAAPESDDTQWPIKQLSEMHHDLIVAMQAAWIEWRRGSGDAAKAMVWIENTLDGPGLIPASDAPYANEAQAFYDLNRTDPYGPCEICGRPSHVKWMKHVACSQEHLTAIQEAEGFDQRTGRFDGYGVGRSGAESSNADTDAEASESDG